MKYLKTYLWFLLCTLTGAYICAADAPKADLPTVSGIDPSATKLSSAHASVSKESERNVDLFDKITVADLRTERDAAKARVAELEGTVAQLQVATAKLQEQRDATLNLEIQRAMQAAVKK